MSPDSAAVDFSRRAAKIREIARGIYDKSERRVVVKFVNDAEKLLAAAWLPVAQQSQLEPNPKNVPPV